MGRVPAGAAHWIKLVKPAQRAERAVEYPGERTFGERFEIDRDQVHEVVEAALLDRQRPFHKSFAEIEARPRSELPVEGRVVEPHRDARPSASGDGMNLPSGIHNVEPAD